MREEQKHVRYREKNPSVSKSIDVLPGYKKFVAFSAIRKEVVWHLWNQIGALWGVVMKDGLMITEQT